LKKKKSSEELALWQRVLLIEKLPYLLSLLFIGVGLCLSYIFKNLEEWPVIEYSIKHSKSIKINDQDLEVYSIKVQNITNKYVFEKMDLYIDYDNEFNYQIIDASLQIPPPSFFPDVGSSLENISSLYYKLSIQHLQPSSEFSISVIVDGKFKPSLRVYSKDRAKVLEANLLTFLFKNQLQAIAATCFLWILIISLYLIFYAKNLKTKTNEKC